ncbi:glycosyltransferase family 4 protein [Candidatus Woesearchaeota archaeon]|nr:glycosyltransferase family 4 protein [Candidatus Woesearchaeota archaeon]
MIFIWGCQDTKIFKKHNKKEILKIKKKFNINKNEFVIVSPRSLQEHYNHEYLIKALSKICKKYKNIKLILFGYGNYYSHQDNIFKLIEDLKLNKNLIFLPKLLNKKELAEIFNISDVCVSIPNSDQFSSALVEGMACGSAPIVSDIPAYNEFLKNKTNALYVNNKDEEDIANNIIYLIKNRFIKNNFYRINRIIILKNLDTKKQFKLMENAYRDFLNESNSKF